jgi:hypothetical protein
LRLERRGDWDGAGARDENDRDRELTSSGYRNGNDDAGGPVRRIVRRR